MEFNNNNNSANAHDVSKKNDTSEAVKPETVEVDRILKDEDMEASVTADDVMRAGGFGARDDISSFLPVASDSTDFEASLRHARDYEEPQKHVCRPGLGWKHQDPVKQQDY